MIPTGGLPLTIDINKITEQVRADVDDPFQAVEAVRQRFEREHIEPDAGS